MSYQKDFKPTEFQSSGSSPTLQPRGFRIRDAANYLSVSPWFVEIAVRQKQIPAHKLGRHYVIFKDDLDDYVTRLRNGGAAGGGK
jgi:excisionase family DNA binding protein